MDPIQTIAATSIARKNDAKPSSAEIYAFYEEHGSGLFVAIWHALRRMRMILEKLRRVRVLELRFAKGAKSR